MLIYADGMDLYAAVADMVEAGWQYSGSLEVVAASGRFGGNCAKPKYTGKLKRSVSIAGNEIGVQGAFKLESLTDATDEDFVELYNNSGADMCVQLTVLDTGAIRLKDSTGATVATTAANVVKEGIWQYFEMWALINNGAGTVVVNVDDVEVINESGVDTAITATDVDVVAFCGCSDSSTKGVYWDDIVIMDDSGAQMNALLGDVRIDTLSPNEDTSQEDWLLSAGSYSNALINDTVPGDHDGDSTYIESNTVGHETRVGFESLAGANTIHAISVATSIKKTDAGSRTMRALINSNGTESVGATQSPTTDYQTVRDFFELNPDGNSAWTSSAINSLEAGVEVVA